MIILFKLYLIGYLLSSRDKLDPGGYKERQYEMLSPRGLTLLCDQIIWENTWLTKEKPDSLRYNFSKLLIS